MAEKKVKSKQYSLTTEERDLLQSQANLKSQHAYIATLIERDMFIYVNTQVRKRLSIAKDMELSHDVQKGIVTATPIQKSDQELKN